MTKIKTNWPRFINWYLTHPKTSGLIVFILLAAIFSYVSTKQYYADIAIKKTERIKTLEEVQESIEQSLKNCYISALTLALTINDNGDPEHFEEIGQKLLQSNSEISAVQLVPNGIIKFTYPSKGNEEAMNLNIFKAEHTKKEALKSIHAQKMYFAGPLELKQGDQAIVGRLPIYIKKKFWGFSAVIVKLDKFIASSGINQIDHSKYQFQLSKKNVNTGKEEYFLPQKIKLTDSNFLKSTIPDGNWEIYIIDAKESHLLISYIVNIILGVLLALTFAILTFILLKKPAQLHEIVKEQAASLIEGEIKFKTIFDQAAVGIANVNGKTGGFIEINNYFCKMLGYSDIELKLKNFQSITHPDDLKEDLQNVKKMKNGVINEYSMEKRYFTKQGKIIWVNLNVTPLLNHHNEQISSIAIVEDITLRKETEALIKKSENHFKSLFEDSPLPLREEDFSNVKLYLSKLNLMNKNSDYVEDYLLNNPKVTYKLHSLVEVVNVNKAYLNLYKVSTKEELLNTQNSLLSPASYFDFTQQVIAITKNQEEIVLDTIIKNSEEQSRFINLKWNVLRGYEKTLGRIIISSEDITERKRAEKIISTSQLKIESLINTIDGIVWECTPNDFNFTFISKKVEEILGYTAEEWLSNPNFWKEHIYIDDKSSTIAFCVEKTANKEDHDFEYRMIAKDGRIVWLRDIISIIIENGKVVSLRGIMIDISKTKEVEKDLKKSFDLVNEQNKRLLNFSYIVSHNLRSHTSNISSLTSLIETSDDEDEKKEMVQLLKSVSNNLNDTLYNLNEVVNIQTNIGIVTEKLNLKNYLDTTLVLLADQIKLKKVLVNTNITNDIELIYNPAYLESILHNVISNAIRYSDTNKSATVTINYKLENNKHLIEITDNGIGIDLDRNGNKIFGMYKTFSNNTDSKGIGLFITKNQIEAMGGTITIESKPDLGTKFKIYL